MASRRRFRLKTLTIARSAKGWGTTNPYITITTMITSSPRLECPSAATVCRPVAYYMLGIMCVYIIMCLTSENPTLWMFVWCVNYMLIWLCCNTAILVSHIICSLSFHLFNFAPSFRGYFVTITIQFHQHITWHTVTINGNNGEWTNADDLDHASRVRTHREARNRRHAVNPNIGNLDVSSTVHLLPDHLIQLQVHRYPDHLIRPPPYTTATALVKRMERQLT